MWTVLYLPEADGERRRLPAVEQASLINADRKLQALGPRLPYPHSSAVKVRIGFASYDHAAAVHLGALYRQVGDVFVVAAVAPEAQVDSRKFDAACRSAERRLSQIEEE